MPVRRGRCFLAKLVYVTVIMVVNTFKTLNNVFRRTVVGGAEFCKGCIVIAQLGIDIT